MTRSVNIREIVLGILMEITEEEAYSHVVIRNVLEKYQYLEKRDRAFISRVAEGTLEHLLQLDYIIECFSKVPVYNMKPLIRNLLRISVFQLKYMDSVPDSAVCNDLPIKTHCFSFKSHIKTLLQKCFNFFQRL